jgi:hypothetical protein
MKKPLSIVSLDARLSHVVTQFDRQPDYLIQTHLGKYLIIVTSGYFEQVVQASLTEFARHRSPPEIANYVDSTLSWEGSINRHKLARILNRFDGKWFTEIEKLAQPAEKQAIDSVKELRDQLAHGNENGTGYAAARNYHFLVRSYSDHLFSVIP